MFTRVVRRERPRRTAWALMIAAAIAALVVSAVALALINDSGTYSIEVANKTLSSNLVPLTATPGDGSALAKYIGSSAQDQSSGTGLFDPFVRLQGSPTEKAYNTCSGTNCGGDVTEFDTKVGTWTHPIKVSAIPIVPCEVDSSHAGAEQCWEIFNDINEGNNAKYISLTKVEIYFTQNTDGIITGYPFSASEATLEYQFTGELKIHDVNQGSGRGDLLLLVPVQSFTADDWFVLYSEWGSSDASPDGKTYASEGGFEEWKVRKAPNLLIVKTADNASVNAGQNIGFTITVTNSGPADATGVTVNDPLPNTAGSGVDWSIASQSPASSCSITGSPPSETLGCGPLTLAAGGGTLTVHVTSSTTAASCGTYDNTATFTSTNAGSGTAHDLTAVQCGALLIHKNSTKGTDQRVANAGAAFSVDGPDADALPDFSVTDDTTAAAPDEDADIGEICVTGLAPGSYTVKETSPPTGYGAGSPSAGQSVTVASGTTCATAAAGATATFTNPPLADILVRVDGQSSGEINSSISCVDSGNSSIGSVGDPTPVDPAVLDVNNLPPDTYTCTITIDP